jgi:hypothetical protein
LVGFSKMKYQFSSTGKKMSWQIYQVPDAIVAKNHCRTENEYVPWLVASLECCNDSVHIYGKKQELLFYNNRFRVFDQATENDLLNLYTVFSYLQKTYCNTKEAIDSILGIYTNPAPRFFNLFTANSGPAVQCRAFPVLKNGKLLGVVVTAADRPHRVVRMHREQVSGSTKQWGAVKTGLPARKDFFSPSPGY